MVVGFEHSKVGKKEKEERAYGYGYSGGFEGYLNSVKGKGKKEMMDEKMGPSSGGVSLGNYAEKASKNTKPMKLFATMDEMMEGE